MSVKITIDGNDLSEFGLYVLEGHENPILSETRDNFLTIPGAHGVRDMGATLGPRYFSIPLGFAPKSSYSDLRREADRFKRLLIDEYGRPKTVKLVFNYSPDRYFLARYYGQLPLERLVSMGRFNLPLIAADPHAYFLYTSTNIILDTDIPVMSDITLGAQYEFDINPTPTQVVVCNIINDGTVAVRPTILITGEADYINFWNTRTGEIFFINDVRKPIEINGENYTVKVGGIENFSVLNGEFITLLPGQNQINIDAGGNKNLKAIFDFSFKYI